MKVTTSQIETPKGKIEYTLVGNGRPILIVVGGRIECPTLILHSENDNSVDISHARNAKNNIKSSRLLTTN